ncbi:N-alpha-acetyltransferase, non-catalitic subunit [Dipsacomyces acuminosporus]|nr:N-alpha-acetyltransferase, non-catalitic subunit [Dipsacomyces acuminosporus]
MDDSNNRDEGNSTSTATAASAATVAADCAAMVEGLDLNVRPVIRDESGREWLDITKLMQQGISEIATGELLKPQSFSLFDAMTSMEVMDPRLDMGMLSKEDEEEIAKWDMDRKLTFTDALWILNRMFCCEMTWQDSASLLQTIYMCNYFTAPVLPETIARPAETQNPVRDLVLYPLLIATGRCCRLVWTEYMRENVYTEEDVYFGSYATKFFDEYTLVNAIDFLAAAKSFLVEQLAKHGELDEKERKAAQMILDQLELRRLWLNVLVYISVDYLIEDPSALEKSMHELKALKDFHTDYMSNYRGEIGEDGDQDAGSPINDLVPGVFDRKCMRNYPSLAPIKPRKLKSLSESHKFLANIINDLALVKELLGIEDVESMLYFFLSFSRRSPTPSPVVRSLVVSVFSCEGRVQLLQPIMAFIARAIKEVTGSYIWDVLDTVDEKAKSLSVSYPSVGELMEAKERIMVFCQEAARMLIDWCKTLCQNSPRQRRIATKYLVVWDSLQGEAEQLDILLYNTINPQSSGSSEEALDPSFNPFWFSSWAYHMKLIFMEIALLSGIRLDVYLSHELPTIFCYATQIFEAHYAHLSRMARMISAKQGRNPQLLSNGRHRQTNSALKKPVMWTMRAVSDSDCLAQIERWQVIMMAQKDMATALWLVSHGCERLGVFKAPWAQRKTQLALETCKSQESGEARAARYALRFRVFSRLNSPTPLSFDGWLTTMAQLDEYRISELFVHASKLLGSVKMGLESSRKAMVGEHGSQPAVFGAWDVHYKALYFVVLSNSLNLGKFIKSSMLQSPALGTTGADSLVYREQLLSAAIASFTDNKSADSPSADTQQQQPPTAVSKSKAKRDKKKKKKQGAGAKQDADALDHAKEWQANVDSLLTEKSLDVEWKLMAEKHPDWPIFSF